MAGIMGVAQTVKIGTGSGSSDKTLLQLKAAANQRLKIKEISVSFDGTSNTAAPILVKVMRQTDDGTSSVLALVKVNPSDDETLQATARHTATVEPATTDTVMAESVHPQTGFTWQAPWGGEKIVPGGGRIAVVVNSSVAVNAVARMVFEE